MKMYVASSSRDREVAKIVAEHFEEFYGAEITHRWWKHFEGVTAEIELPLEQQRQYAADDLAGVAACDVFVILVTPNTMRGSLVEYGYALALNKKILVLGDTIDQPSIFWRLANEVTDIDAELGEYKQLRLVL